MGGLGPGLTGEHTLYSYVVVREDTDNEEDRCPKSWVITHRYSSFHVFDKILLQIIKEEGGDETWLGEVTVHAGRKSMPMLPEIMNIVRPRKDLTTFSSPLLSFHVSVMSSFRRKRCSVR